MNDDFDLSEWYASNDGIDLVKHVVSPRVAVVEQVNDFGTLGCDVFVDGEYAGSGRTRKDYDSARARIMDGLTDV